MEARVLHHLRPAGELSKGGPGPFQLGDSLRALGQGSQGGSLL